MEGNQMSEHHSPAERPNKMDEELVERDEEVKEPGFWSLENLKVAKVSVICGFLNGYTIGFVPMHVYLYYTSTDCSLYKSEEACSTVFNAKCLWDIERSSCGWEEFTCATAYPTDESNPLLAEEACRNDNRCNWIYNSDECKNLTGYTSVENGIFACAMILGAMFGSMFSGKLVVLAGFNVTFTIAGIIALVSSIMFHISVKYDQFWVLCVGRLLIGLTVGTIYVSCPMYLNQNAIRKYYHLLGIFMGVFTPFGSMIAAILGLTFNRSIDFEKNAHIDGYMQGLCAFSTLLSFLFTLNGIFLPKSKVQFTKSEDKNVVVLNPNEYSWRQMAWTLTIGVVIAGSSQLTGINAVTNYSPQIMGRLGVEPLVGALLVTSWNFLSALFTIVLLRWFDIRFVFVTASFVASFSCLLLCGIPVYPGVASSNVKTGVAVTGVLLFILAFAVGLGGCFIILTQDIFPASFRPKGAAFVMMVQFVFNIIINLCFPIAVENISGGPSGDQDKGQSIVFIFFGCIGLICSIIEFFFLQRWEDKQAKESNTQLTVDDSNAVVKKKINREESYENP